MKTLTKIESIRQRILAGGERFWNHQDLADYPPATIAKTFTAKIAQRAKNVHLHFKPLLVMLLS
jgi:hypothetical protein